MIMLLDTCVGKRGEVGFTTAEKITFKRQRVTRIGVTQGCLGSYCSILQPDNPDKAKIELLDVC